MKKVALITDGWKRFLLYAWPHGIMQFIDKYPEDVCLYHYSCHGNWSSEKVHNIGEYNIVNLPNLEGFDGVIFDCNNIEDPEQVEYMLHLIRKSKVPAVAIARDFGGFYYAGIDNEKSIHELCKHMYDVHGSRHFVFAGGPEGNYENELRAKAYKSAIEEFGLSLEENPVFYGDYDFDSGVKFFKKYISDGNKVPDVFICASDNIAAGICTEAEAWGYTVPEDFYVTGFDNLDKAAYFKPQITTVDHNRGSITYAAMQILTDIWNGRNPDKYTYVDTTCIYSESCGCPNSGTVDYREYMKGQIIYGVQKAFEDSRISSLEAAIASYTRFEDMYQVTGEFMKGYDCDGFFIVIDDYLTDVRSKTRMSVKGYNHEHMSVVYARDGERKMKFNSVQDMYDYIDRTGKNNHFMFTPIHFKQYSVGYTILKNPRFLYHNANFYDIHNILVKGLESQHAHIRLENVNKKLKEIYNKDQLTGIYNRIAYAETISPSFARYYKEGVVCAVGFIDVDKFKQINDTYGHDYGDDILKKVANILQRRCPKNGYACRYGGDEFIIFFPYATEESAAEVKQAINEDAAAIGIKLSIGVVLSSENHGGNISAYFEVADKYMYEEKQRHKQEDAQS